MKGGPASALTLLLAGASAWAQMAAARAPETPAQIQKNARAARASQDALEAADRAELVLPPSASFRPQSKGPRPALRLALKQATVKSGEPIYFTLSLTNEGGAPFLFRDQNAFFKYPRIDSSVEWQFWLTSSHGDNTRLIWGRRDASIKRMARTLPNLSADPINEDRPPHWQDLRLTLQPGETVQMRRWDAAADERREKLPRPGAGWVELYSDQMPTAPGEYTLRVVMNDTPPPFRKASPEDGISQKDDEAFRKLYEADAKRHLGTISSNTIPFRVEPQ